MSDKDHTPHIEYRIIAEKPYELDVAPNTDCYDHFEGTIHGKGDIDRLIGFLRGNGYKVKLIRVSHTSLIDEKFGHEQEPGESSPPPAP
jgi:hypothetical protein